MLNGPPPGGPFFIFGCGNDDPDTALVQALLLRRSAADNDSRTPKAGPGAESGSETPRRAVQRAARRAVQRATQTRSRERPGERSRERPQRRSRERPRHAPESGPGERSRERPRHAPESGPDTLQRAARRAVQRATQTRSRERPRDAPESGPETLQRAAQRRSRERPRDARARARSGLPSEDRGSSRLGIARAPAHRSAPHRGAERRSEVTQDRSGFGPFRYAMAMIRPQRGSERHACAARGNHSPRPPLYGCHRLLTADYDTGRSMLLRARRHRRRADDTPTLFRRPHRRRTGRIPDGAARRGMRSSTTSPSRNPTAVFDAERRRAEFSNYPVIYPGQ